MDGIQSKSMNNALMYSAMTKGTSRAEAMSKSKKVKPVALAIVELCKSEGISQAGS